jgi:predicted permease
VPGRIADGVLREIDDGYQLRCERDGEADAGRWLRRQLLLALRPGRLRDLRRLETRALVGHDDGLSARLGRGLGAAATDLRYALRLLWARPGFSLLTIAVLTGGLAVSIFTFSFLHTAMYAPLPVPGGDRLVRVMANYDGRSNWFDARDFAAIRDSLPALDRVGIWETRLLVLRGEQESRSLRATWAEPSMFEVAGSAPALGRTLLSSDSVPGAEPVAVLSHTLWVSAFGSDEGVVDRIVRANGIDTRIVGVMPEGFGFPVFGMMWLPIGPESVAPYERGRMIEAYASLSAGATRAQADAELHAAVQRLRTDADATLVESLPRTAYTRTFQKMQFGDEADLFFATMNLAAGFILLLACVNAGNLMLSRGLERSREIDIRVALGAPRLRLVAQMMAEGVVITAIAGTAAVLIASRALTIFDQVAHAALPEGLAYWWNWGMNQPTLLVAGLLVAATTLLVGGIPAWRATRAETDAALREGPQGGSSRELDRLSRGLVVFQVATLSVLLFLGGATATITWQAGTIDLGFDAEGVMLGQLSLPEETYPTPESRVTFARSVLQRVTASAAVTGAMVRSGGGQSRVAAEGESYEDALQLPRAVVRSQLGGGALLGIDLLAGRRLAPGDDADSEPVAIVSAQLARELWGETSPLGQRLRVVPEQDSVAASEVPEVTIEAPWHLVVGVVADVLEGNPLSRDRHGRSIYLPLAQQAPAAQTVAFRHAGDPRAAVRAFTDAVGAVDPELVADDILNLDTMLQQMIGISRTVTWALLGSFGLTLLLALGGIYGLTARSVLGRRHEVGIRRALGATDRGILGLFLRGSARRLLIGFAIGTAVVSMLLVAASRFYAIDPVLLAGTAVAVTGSITALVMAATWVPTRHAVRMAPRDAIWGD